MEKKDLNAVRNYKTTNAGSDKVIKFSEGAKSKGLTAQEAANQLLNIIKDIDEHPENYEGAIEEDE